jgi:hypothetical protein
MAPALLRVHFVASGARPYHYAETVVRRGSYEAGIDNERGGTPDELVKLDPAGTYVNMGGPGRARRLNLGADGIPADVAQRFTVHCRGHGGDVGPLTLKSLYRRAATAPGYLFV